MSAHDDAKQVRAALDECLKREGLQTVLLEGTAPVIESAGAHSYGSVTITRPDLGILHVVGSSRQARAVVRAAGGPKLSAQGRVVYDRAKVAPGLRAQVRACIGKAED